LICKHNGIWHQKNYNKNVTNGEVHPKICRIFFFYSCLWVLTLQHLASMIWQIDGRGAPPLNAGWCGMP
jgi:hypothetical protein